MGTVHTIPGNNVQRINFGNFVMIGPGHSAEQGRPSGVDAMSLALFEKDPPRSTILQYASQQPGLVGVERGF